MALIEGRGREIVLVPRDAVPVFEWKIIEHLQAGHSLPETAATLGISRGRLWRFLRSRGYSPAQGWTKEGAPNDQD